MTKSFTKNTIPLNENMADPLAVAAAEERLNEGNNGPAMMAVVSGESDGALSDDEDLLLSPQRPSSSDPHDSDANRNDRGEEFKSDGSEIIHPTDNIFYGEDLDDDDEAYVYKNLRGGKPAKKGTSSLAGANNQAAEGITTNPALPSKPRNSDAVLSCPCCFAIVCMDCQRHVKYENQYRAMFVMGIEVDWQHRLVHNTKTNGLIRYEPPPIAENTTNSNSQIVVPEDHPHQQHSNPTSSATDRDTIYYAVSCGNCHTMVAALDMNDEVYHFYDCLASS